MPTRFKFFLIASFLPLLRKPRATLEQRDAFLGSDGTIEVLICKAVAVRHGWQLLNLLLTDEGVEAVFEVVVDVVAFYRPSCVITWSSTKVRD